MMRGSHLLLALVTTLILIVGSSACGARDSSPPHAPHIVLLLADDLGWGDVGFGFGTGNATPAIDAFAREALILDRFYTAPICTPTRAALMTGRDPVVLGMLANLRPRDTGGLPAAEVTLAERLQATGYVTHLVGKWHLGHTDPAQHPNAQGFDHFYGHLGGFIDYYDHTRDGALDWQRDGVTIEEDGYSTRLLANEAVRVLNEHDAEKPLLLTVAFNAAHIPLQWPPGTRRRRATVDGAERVCFEAMLAELDDAIARILTALEARGMRNDTLVVFASDNGGSTAHGGNNGQLRYGKYGTYEGGIRAPAAVRWPGHLSPGRSDAIVTAFDLSVSLAAAGGAQPDASEGLDGRYVFDSLDSGQELPPRVIGFGLRRRDRNRYALIEYPLKLVQIVHREEKRVDNALFNLAEDPDEENDLAPGAPQDLARLSGLLDAWKARYPGPIPGDLR